MNRYRWGVTAGKSVFRFLALFLVLALVLGCRWAGEQFGEISLDQALFHLQIMRDGLVATDANLKESFARQMALAAVLAYGLLMPRAHGQVLLLAWRSMLPYIKLGVLWLREQLRDGRCLGFLLVVALLFVAWTFGAFAAWGNASGQELFGKYYVPPDKAEVRAGPRHNIVLIYVESLEKAYSDVDRFGENLLAPLEGLPAPSGGSRIVFPEMYQSVGTGWTIAGLVSTQCAVPLHSVLLGDGNQQGEQLDSFMPGAYCLGDLLRREGYRNVFMHGPDSSFAGVATYLRSHGYEDIRGREYWLQHGYSKTRMHGWGLYDEDLMREGAKRFDSLVVAGQPFNLSLLTIDTHGPEGFLNPACRDEGYQGFAGVVACTADRVAGLVKHIQASPAGRNTVVVVMGDHLSMRNPLSGKLQNGGERGVYNLILTPEPVKAQTNSVSRFDMLPTMLAAMGWRINGDRLGLGVNGFAPAARRSGDWRRQLDRAAGNKSPEYLKLWRRRDSN